MPGQLDDAPFDIDAEIYSESVLLSVVSADASSGVLTRLCRYPEAGVAWVWVHVATPGGSWTYAEDRVACGNERLDLGADGLAYPAGPDLDGEWVRSGSRNAPGTARCRLRVPAHAEGEAAPGPGPVALDLDVQFTAEYSAGGTLPGRTEVLGRATAVVRGSGPDVEFTGAAQWHEQEQSAPRFRAPFTYSSLRGDGVALIALAGPVRSGGFIRGTAGNRLLTRAEIAAPEDGSHRHTIDLSTDDGQVLQGDAEIVHEYHLPLYGRAWRGTFVRARIDGSDLSGFINRWRPDAAPFETRS